MENNDAEKTKFHGFKEAHFGDFFKYPKVLTFYWHVLTGSEQKCLDFILRQIVGYKGKEEDAISLSQFVSGIGKNNKGTGVSRSQVRRAIESLEKKGFIVIQRQRFRPSVFRLRYEDTNHVEETEQHESSANPEILRLIGLFKKISPVMVEAFLRDSRQIKAMERLTRHYESSDIEWYLEAIACTNQMHFSPTITSPVELEQKIAKLDAFIGKPGNEETLTQLMSLPQ